MVSIFHSSMLLWHNCVRFTLTSNHQKDIFAQCSVWFAAMQHVHFAIYKIVYAYSIHTPQAADGTFKTLSTICLQIDRFFPLHMHKAQTYSLFSLELISFYQLNELVFLKRNYYYEFGLSFSLYLTCIVFYLLYFHLKEKYVLILFFYILWFTVHGSCHTIISFMQNILCQFSLCSCSFYLKLFCCVLCYVVLFSDAVIVYVYRSGFQRMYTTSLSRMKYAKI